jgi:hypothetical protein
MSLTRHEYDDLIERSDAGEICFMFDPTQCKDFLLKLDNPEALATTGNPLRFVNNKGHSSHLHVFFAKRL